MEHGGLVSNTWVTCLEVGDTPWKHGIIPNTRFGLETESERGDCLALRGACGPTKATMSIRPERVDGHTGTEIRPRLLREAAAKNLPQWAKA